MNANQAKTKSNLKEMREDIKPCQAEMRSIPVLNEWIAKMKMNRKETMSCQVKTTACLESYELNQEKWNPKWNIRKSLRKRPQ
jgi:hypothetical protein